MPARILLLTGLLLFGGLFMVDRLASSVGSAEAGQAAASPGQQRTHHAAGHAVLFGGTAQRATVDVALDDEQLPEHGLGTNTGHPRCALVHTAAHRCRA